MDGLPPLDQPVAWVVVHGQERIGPYALDVLIDEVVAGRLAETTPVWWPPLVDWTTVMANDALVTEIERRRHGSVPGWAPLSLTGGTEPVGLDEDFSTDSGSTDGRVGAPHGSGPVVVERAATVEIVEAEVVDPDPDHDPVVEDGDIVDAIITVPSTIGHRTNRLFLDLVGRSARVAEQMDAITAADQAFVIEMIAVGDRHGLGFTDHHSGSDEHRIHLRDVSGNRELTVLLGRIGTASRHLTVCSTVPLSVVLSARGAAMVGRRSSPTGGTADEHGTVSVLFDERSGRMNAAISLFLTVSDYVDDFLTVNSSRLHDDLDSVVEELIAALAD